MESKSARWGGSTEWSMMPRDQRSDKSHQNLPECLCRLVRTGEGWGRWSSGDSGAAKICIHDLLGTMNVVSRLKHNVYQEEIGLSTHNTQAIRALFELIMLLQFYWVLWLPAGKSMVNYGFYHEKEKMKNGGETTCNSAFSRTGYEKKVSLLNCPRLNIQRLFAHKTCWSTINTQTYRQQMSQENNPFGLNDDRFTTSL